MVKEHIEWPFYITHSFDLCQAILKSSSKTSLELKKNCQDLAQNQKLSTVYQVLFPNVPMFNHHNADDDVDALIKITNHPDIKPLLKNKGGHTDIQVIFEAQRKRSRLRLDKFRGSNRETFEKHGWMYENTVLGDNVPVTGTQPKAIPSDADIRPAFTDPAGVFTGEPEGPSVLVSLCTTLMQLFFLFLPLGLLEGN